MRARIPFLVLFVVLAAFAWTAARGAAGLFYGANQSNCTATSKYCEGASSPYEALKCSSQSSVCGEGYEPCEQEENNWGIGGQNIWVLYCWCPDAPTVTTPQDYGCGARVKNPHGTLSVGCNSDYACPTEGETCRKHGPDHDGCWFCKCQAPPVPPDPPE